jgi:hypothetical protein
MAYGLKVWTASSYLAFNSEDMDSYAKVVIAGTVYLGSYNSETFPIPSGFDRVYINGPSTNQERSWTVSYSAYDSSVGGYTSFTINSLSQSGNFGYVAIRLN